MIEAEITRLSSKGQIVIPSAMRKDMKSGEKILLLKGEGGILLKKFSEMDEQFKEDLEFARRTEEAWKEHDEGNFKSYSPNDFLKRL